ncbi:STAS domain-containing protein [Azospirillum sp.]|uniref:STAS domain-containing protein n=1 Tax=Azospirillum sp. TaxID=34012 RepID=UPI003D74D109
MDIQEETRNGVVVLRPAGRIDSGTAAVFEKRVAQAVAAGKVRVVIDMGGVSGVGSAGLRSLLMASKRAHAGGSRIVLAGLSPAVRRDFDTSGFTGLFAMHADVEAALKALAP